MLEVCIVPDDWNDSEEMLDMVVHNLLLFTSGFGSTVFD